MSRSKLFIFGFLLTLNSETFGRECLLIEVAKDLAVNPSEVVRVEEYPPRAHYVSGPTGAQEKILEPGGVWLDFKHGERIRLERATFREVMRKLVGP